MGLKNPMIRHVTELANRQFYLLKRLGERAVHGSKADRKFRQFNDIYIYNHVIKHHHFAHILNMK